MKKVLLLTGRQAYKDLVTLSLSNEKFQVYIEQLPINIAAFTTIPLLRRHLPSLITKYKPDLVLISGLAIGDFTELNSEFQIPILKGTRSLFSLPELFSILDELNLSPKKSADRFLVSKAQEMIEQEIKRRTQDQTLFLSNNNFSTMGGLIIGRDFPSRIFAEIVDATLKDPEIIKEQAQYFLENGADVIDLGGSVRQCNPEGMAQAVEVVKELGAIVSIDSLDSEEIITGVEAGGEIILSIDFGNKKLLQTISPELILVVIPTNVSKGIFPATPLERAKKCKEILEEVRAHGFEKILVDPLLEAFITPGFTRSLQAYIHFRDLSLCPMFAGTGNVTEFFDADTAGLNSTLCNIAQELGIAGLLSTEERTVTRYSIQELQLSSKLAFAARVKKASPKHLSPYSCFFAKSGHKSDIFEIQRLGLPIETIPAKLPVTYTRDCQGSFRISINHRKGLIFLAHMVEGKYIHIFKTSNCKDALNFLLSQNLISELSHATYLGRELSKAEICLKLGKEYSQDQDFETSFSLLKEEDSI